MRGEIISFWKAFGVIIIIIIIAGCGGGSSGKNITTTITGYVEDDPISNAKIRIFDKTKNIIAEIIADTNGKYILDASLKNGEIYTIEANGKLSGKNITLHSIFKYSKDTIININPITELKYQLVQSGKSIDEAEQLIRDYFMIISGKSLESNRFDVNSPISIGMLELAKLYDGKLPVDAIEKIKNDILSNSTLKEEDREYQYREMLKADLELVSSTDSQEVGKKVNISLKGVDSLNPKYSIEWIGIPNNSNKEKLTQTFTLNEPQKRIVIASLYLKDEQNSSNKIFLNSVSTQVDFYKVGKAKKIVVKNGDTNISISSDIKINIPNGALSEGEEIVYKDIITQNSNYVKAFILEPSGTIFAEPLEIHVKYDSLQINDPRLLTIIRVSDDGKKDILKVKRIDYKKRELIFETEHFSKFIIEKDIPMWKFWEKTSFAKWDEAYDAYGDFPNAYTPYQYLRDSLKYYCSEYKIEENKCNDWKKYFYKEEAKKIAGAFANIMNDNNNYDIFTNDYFIWRFLSNIEHERSHYRKYVPSDNETLKKMIGFLYLAKLDSNRKFTVKEYDKSFLNYNAYSYYNSTFIKRYFYKYIKDKINLQNYINDKISEEVITSLVGEAASKFITYATNTYSFFTSFWGDFLNHSVTLRVNPINACGNDWMCRLNDFLGFENNKKTFSINKDNGYIQIDEKIPTENESLNLVKHIYPAADELDEFNTHIKRLKFLSAFYGIVRFTYTYHNDEARHNFISLLNKKCSILALQILQYANKVKTSNLVSEKQAKIRKLREYFQKQKEPLEPSFKRVGNSNSKIVTIPLLDSFNNFLEQIKINIPKSKWNSIKIKKLSLRIEKYNIEKEDSTDTTATVFETSSFDGVSSFSKSNIDKSGFDFVDEKYTKSLASIFTDLDTGNFQDNFLTVKVSILINLNGKDRVISKDYQFITYADIEDDNFCTNENGTKANPISDCGGDNEGGNDIKITDLVSGHLSFVNEEGYNISIPSNTWIRITPKEHQVEGNWNGVNCKINSDGNFGSECYIHSDEQEMRELFQPSADTSYQIIIYKESTGDTHFNPEEEDIGHIIVKDGKDPYEVDYGVWKNAKVRIYSNNIEIDPQLQITIDLNENQLKAIFNKDMQNNYYISGDYELEQAYWMDKRTFVVDLKSYVPAGKIIFHADSFETVEGKIMSKDIEFIFPE